ncbi:lysophospholipid acyltransferase family protein [candidate division KSB1 bacterium]|nr:lysophospholipid acyltransferase family protein [candidate division KSB1 bacterium]
MNEWKNRIEYAALLIVTRIVQSLAPATAVRLGRLVGAVVYHCIPIRRAVVLANLGKAMPALTQKQRRTIARNTYIMFGRNFFEFLRTPVRSSEEIAERVLMHNLDVLRDSCRSGRGTLLMSGHFGNWEVMACAIVAAGFPLVVIARRQRNILVDRMINAFRQSAGIETVPLGMGVREFLRALRQNKLVALLADQDAHNDGVFVDYFNIPSATAAGPALLALKTGAQLIFSTCIQRQDGKYEAFFEKIPTDDLSGTSEENVRIVTQRHAAKLEEKVRRWPDHWFWMHRRWKTPPPSDYVSIKA